jgi:acyl carrier protein
MWDDLLAGQVRQIMAEAFGMNETDLSDNPSQDALTRWTSLAHFVLLVGLEDHFNLSFTPDEMMSMTSLDRIVGVLGTRSLDGAGMPA